MKISVGPETSARLKSCAAWVLVAASVLSSNSCAGSPASLASMDATTIQSAPEDKLCFAQALFLRMHEDHPVVRNEVARRHADCSDQVAQQVIDCSMLKIEDAYKSSSDEGVKSKTFFVSNTTSVPRAFHICVQADVTRTLYVGPNGTGKFTVANSEQLKNVAVLSGVYCVKPQLIECVAAPGAVSAGDDQ